MLWTWSFGGVTVCTRGSKFAADFLCQWWTFSVRWLTDEQNCKVVKGMKNLLPLAKWKGTYTPRPRRGERNHGVTDYLCEVAVNTISTSMTRESIFLSLIICTTSQQAQLLCKARFHVIKPQLLLLWDPELRHEPSEISARRLRAAQVLFLKCLCWQLGLHMHMQLTLSTQLLKQSHKQVWGLSFTAVFSLFKVLESHSTQIKEFMHFGIEETALSNCSWINDNQGLSIAGNRSGWGAEKPGRVSEFKSGVEGEHYLI